MLRSEMRIQISTRPEVGDGRKLQVLRAANAVGAAARDARIVDVYIVHGLTEFSRERAVGFFSDRVAQQAVADFDAFYKRPWQLLFEITSRPGVADPVASSIRDALATELGELPPGTVVQTARQILLDLAPQPDVRGAPSANAAEAARTETPDPEVLARLFHNPLIQQATIITRQAWDAGERPPERYPVVESHEVPPVQRIDLTRLSDEELQQLSREKLFALSRDEMRAVRDYYDSPDVRRAREASGLGADATDMELEMIAQTWSEHCKHKIFAAKISYTESGVEVARSSDGAPVVADAAVPEVIDSLFRTYIRDTTRRIATDDSFVKSVFDDNAGVIAFDDETLLCFKAETHNSPSALDPYGGAITGIVGVNRDILGTGIGAAPIFNTDVLCFGRPDTPADELPEGLLHPATVLHGVHHGIIDGGNQSGIPVAAGAFLFDESYVGKPLVFCGTGGMLPATVNGEASWVKHVRPGDLAVMVGGRIGKDGIHGATFSSLGLDESSPTSAVQIGEPITQRKMTDFLMEARDAGLYNGITDNGAGGLSSSLGEMARDSGGVDIDLDACPLKYGGLAAWEILVSESQERMSLAVAPGSIDALLALARRRGVEATVVGTFSDDGMIRIRHQGVVVGEIDLEFLHDGLPQMELVARWPGPRTSGHRMTGSGATGSGTGSAGTAIAHDDTDPQEIHSTLLELLAEPNIASKEHLVRQYDHEVQGSSVVKPQCGIRADGPSDGAVLRPRYDSPRGITVTHGIAPRYGDVDTYHMATATVDEAVRAHVALGGDPERMAALDNFCWPDPVLSESTPDGPFKLAQLVRACRGLADACVAFSLPLISGKDSMKNDSYLGGRKVSIRPTLLVSLIGIVPDVSRALTTAFIRPGDAVLLIGTGRPALGGSAYERLRGDSLGECPVTNLAANAALYRAVHRATQEGLFSSIHDVADGGLGIALAESAIGGRLGAEIVLPAALAQKEVSGVVSDSLVRELFGERTGTFVATWAPGEVERIAGVLGEGLVTDLGRVIAEPELRLCAGGDRFTWGLEDLVTAWRGLARALGEDIAGGATPDREQGAAGAAMAAAASRARRPEQDAGAATSAAAPGVGGAPRTMSIPPPPTLPRVLLLTGYGINANRELGEAFRRSGADVNEIHVNDLLANPATLDDARILALPGGFSYGDHVGSGLMLAHRMREIRSELDVFRASGRLILGICNGFQVLVKMGILPDLGGDWNQEVSLVHNENGRFEDSWVRLIVDDASGSPWLSGISGIQAPIRHGEGRFVVGSDEVLSRIVQEKRIAVRYAGRNPNGSVADIAGIVDRTGCVLGMMPHPEAFLIPQSHPFWREDPEAAARAQECAMELFANAVRHARGV